MFQDAGADLHSILIEQPRRSPHCCNPSAPTPMSSPAREFRFPFGQVVGTLCRASALRVHHIIHGAAYCVIYLATTHDACLARIVPFLDIGFNMKAIVLLPLVAVRRIHLPGYFM